MFLPSFNVYEYTSPRPRIGDPRVYHYAMSAYLQMEPTVGFEPTTDGLQNHCSTTELCWLDAICQNLHF